MQFTDTSKGEIDAWFWEFGDGGQSSEQNPANVYTTEGLYKVTLTVSGPGGRDTEPKENFIDVKPPAAPVADFSASPSTGIVPLGVKFTDQSKNSPNAWIWDFGDGGQDSSQNPTHTYQNAGIFSVKLTAANDAGQHTQRKPNLINVISRDLVVEFSAAPTVGLAPLTVQFKDLSEPVGSLVSWLWSFGDGGNAQEQNPRHEYRFEGFFSVMLTVNSPIGSKARTKTNLIIAEAQGAPVAEFKASPTAGQPPLSVSFTDLSQPAGNIASWIWDFDDGAADIGQNPRHDYRTAGIFTTMLTVSNANGADTERKTNLIAVIGQGAPIAEFVGSPTVGQTPLKVSFTDNSAGSGIESWIWDFGDGAQTTEQNPSHIYNKEGIFSVKLTVSNASGADIEIKTNLIHTVGAGKPAADFSANPLFGQTPLGVEFIDNSEGNITLWNWDFGDGANGTGQKTTHNYAKEGAFTVTLTVSGAGGSDTIRKEGFIKVSGGGGTPVPIPTPTPTPTPTPMPTPTPVPTLTPTPTPVSKANLEVSFSPDPVPNDFGDNWTMKVTIKETNGIGVAISRWDIAWPSGAVTSNGVNEFVRLFSDCGTQVGGFIPAFDIACGNITFTTFSGNLTLTFFGIDERGNPIIASGSTTLLEGDSCIASAVLNDKPVLEDYSIENSGNPALLADKRLQILRRFREIVLSKDLIGLKLIRFYYKHSAEVTEILMSDPAMKSKAAGALTELSKILEGATAQDSVLGIVRHSIPTWLEVDINTLLDEIAMRGSDGLRADMDEGRRLLDMD